MSSRSFDCRGIEVWVNVVGKNFGYFECRSFVEGKKVAIEARNWV